MDDAIETRHATLLNSLVEMQETPAYAVRRETLAQAELNILTQEKRISDLTAELETERRRLDFIEKRSRQSYTGVSFDWAPAMEDEPGGWRMMWRRMLGARKKTLREAIDEAMGL